MGSQQYREGEIDVVLGASFCAGLWIENDKGEVLLQLRGSDEPDFPRMWCLPGGRVPKDVLAYDVVMERLSTELGASHVEVGHEPFLKKWVSNGYGQTVSFTLFVPQGVCTMSQFFCHNIVAVPSIGFFSPEQMLEMAKSNELHPATAYAVKELFVRQGLQGLVNVARRRT